MKSVTLKSGLLRLSKFKILFGLVVGYCLVSCGSCQRKFHISEYLGKKTPEPHRRSGGIYVVATYAVSPLSTMPNGRDTGLV